MTVTLNVAVAEVEQVLRQGAFAGHHDLCPEFLGKEPSNRS